MSSTSISVMKFGRAFSLASTLRECLNRRELHALRIIRDRFPLRPLRCVDAPAQFGQFRFRNIYMKRTDSILVRCLLPASLCSTGLGHGVLLVSSFEFFG